MQAYINGSYFNLSQPSNTFWSATQYDASSAWRVVLNFGVTLSYSMGTTGNVRCVR